jgi:hypothetical protein
LKLAYIRTIVDIYMYETLKYHYPFTAACMIYLML